MPRSSVILSAAALTPQGVIAAIGSVWEGLRFAEPDLAEFEIRSVDRGFALQVLHSDVVVLTVTQSRAVRTSEFIRLLPGEALTPGDTAWSELYTPWHSGGVFGLLIAERLADDVGGRCIHRGDIPHLPAM